MGKLPKKLQAKLDSRSSEGNLRSLPGTEGGVDFASNDYLSLAREGAVSTRALELLGPAPRNGSTGSRLLSGNHPLYGELEHHLREWHRAEAALVFNSGYDANLGFFSSVPQRGDLVLYDESIHASIRDGIRLGPAKAHRFAHNDLGDLARLWKRLGGRYGEAEVYLVTESVFSMDGDSPNLVALAGFCMEIGGHLVVDEAHATGLYGGGRDLVAELGLEGQVLARTITFGKALGSHGAALLGSAALVSYLLNFARPMIFTTALPPHALASILAAYRHLGEEGEALRQSLLDRIGLFKAEVRALGLSDRFIPSGSAIQCALVPGNERAKGVAAALQQQGFDIRPILSPTVPLGGERLRFCLHTHNTDEEISRILAGLNKLLNL